MANVNCIWLMMFFIFVLLLSLIFSVGSTAETSHINLEDCGFYLPSTEIGYPHLCSSPRLSFQTSLLGKNDWEEKLFLAASVYAGFHASKWLSIHAQADYESNLGYNESAYFEDSNSSYFPKPDPLKLWYLHLGNPSKDWIQMSIGKTETNFGINRKVIPSKIIEKLKTNYYSQRREEGLIILLDNQRELSFEIGAFSAFKSSKFFLREIEKNETSSIPEFYGRVMIDRSILEGSRWVLSYGNEAENFRSIGLGFLVLSPEGNGGILEWQQRYSGYLFKGNGSEQIIRFQYKGEKKIDSRWLFEIENYRDFYLLTSLFHEFEILSYTYITSGLSYQRSWSREVSSIWIGSLGLDLKI